MTLRRYNEILWAFLGTGAILGLLAVAAAAVLSLWSPGNGVRAPQGGAAKEDRKKASVPSLGEPIVVPESTFYLIPVGLAEPRVGKSRVDWASGSSGEGSGVIGFSAYGGAGGVRNVLFRNAATGEQHFLLDHTALISRLQFQKKPADREDEFVPKGLLYWEIIDRDTNADGGLTAEDAVVGYFSGLDGRKLRPVTPPGCQVVAKVHDEERGLLLLLLRRDSNRDGQFSGADTTEVAQVDLKAPQMATKIVGPEALVPAEGNR